MYGVSREVTTVPVGQIAGLHPDLVAQDRQLGIAPEPFTVLEPGVLPKEAVEVLLELRPVLVRRDRTRYSCVGNVREFMLAAMLLPPEHPIPVRLVKGEEVASRLYWTDRLVTPLIRYTGNRWARWLYHAWRRFTEPDTPPLVPESLLVAGRTQKRFAQALGLDARQLTADAASEAR